MRGMVDMAKTPAEVKDDMPVPIMMADSKPSGPVYPYGLCICLTEEELEKLNLDGDLPEVGDLVHLMAMARVTSVSQSEQQTGDGEKRQCSRVELQIIALKAEDEDREDSEERLEKTEARDKARSESFYDDDEDDE